ncbi:hypothetical protein IAG44_23315 [Streptomyces roseirectus]|uniref:Uncharacterized protein n=1 Tax=Streptomyces roseirectus TaxID=2768066 RepID=A0A7H0IGY9_9ACTN|nr:hypothetical protein [Streptomyces roseirectus]QNP72055.1 hypothetical protein IAG44_23315 [Streptomyces roseirectus]
MGWGTLRAVRLSWTPADTHVAAATASGQIPTVWGYLGTAGSPELFVLFGDPDPGDVRILRPV